MSVSKLVDGGFVPKDVVERMRETLPGRLAFAIGEMLYEGTTGEVSYEPKGGGPPFKFRRFYTAEEIRVGFSTVKEGKTQPAPRKSTEQILRELLDYLEACALRDALNR